MEKLDKVIGSLIGCTVANCSNCEYGGSMCDMDQMMRDAAELLNDLRYDNQRLREMWAGAEKKVSILRAELAEERERSARWLRESEPVVHAHWIIEKRHSVSKNPYMDDNYHNHASCSNCGFIVDSRNLSFGYADLKTTKFCSECGAHMDEQLELRTCYCPICDKHFEVRSNDSGGSCPDCGHHVVLHRLEEADA